jgi:hypothetical protein
MSDRAEMNDARMEGLLRAVGRELDYPPTPALAAGIRHRLDEGPKPSRVRSPLGLRWQPAMATLAILVVIAVAALTFSPQARNAVADFLGVGGVRIGFDDTPHTPPTVTPTGGPDLGPQVSLDEAEREVGFEVKVPELGELGSPQIHLTRPPESGMVSLYYPDAYEEGLLITQFKAGVDEVFFKKLTLEGATVEYLTVREGPAYWVTGSHFFAYVDPGGDIREESLRIAENVLLWEENGITYRIEGGFSKGEALAIAGSLPE